MISSSESFLYLVFAFFDYTTRAKKHKNIAISPKRAFSSLEPSDSHLNGISRIFERPPTNSPQAKKAMLFEDRFLQHGFFNKMTKLGLTSSCKKILNGFATHISFELSQLFSLPG